MNSIFRGLFDTNYTSVISLPQFLLCVGISLLIGAMIAFTSSRKQRASSSFITSLLVMPALACVVIMMVNGNIGVGVATAGTFNLVRYRSAAGTAREMALIFLCMVAGLIAGMGYLAYAVLFAIILCAIFMLTNLFDDAANRLKRRLRITVPEDLNYTEIFHDTLADYCKCWKLIQVKTINMGSLFRLTYDITLRDVGKEKAFIDALRLENGNLEISICEAETQESDL